jgi:hypothetical protein
VQRFAIDDLYEARCLNGDLVRGGYIDHVFITPGGEAVRTEVALLFMRAETPVAPEPHWYVECRLKANPLAPSSDWIERVLVPALQREGVCTGPVRVRVRSAGRFAGKTTEGAE